MTALWLHRLSQIAVPAFRASLLGTATRAQRLGQLHNLSNVTDFFTSRICRARRHRSFISCLEFFGGILLALGLFSRSSR